MQDDNSPEQDSLRTVRHRMQQLVRDTVYGETPEPSAFQTEDIERRADVAIIVISHLLTRSNRNKLLYGVALDSAIHDYMNAHGATFTRLLETTRQQLEDFPAMPDCVGMTNLDDHRETVVADYIAELNHLIAMPPLINFATTFRLPGSGPRKLG